MGEIFIRISISIHHSRSGIHIDLTSVVCCLGLGASKSKIIQFQREPICSSGFGLSPRPWLDPISSLLIRWSTTSRLGGSVLHSRLGSSPLVSLQPPSLTPYPPYIKLHLHGWLLHLAVLIAIVKLTVSCLTLSLFPSKCYYKWV